MGGKFSFLYVVDIWFNLAKCKFIMKNSNFKMLVVIWPISVADTGQTFIFYEIILDTFIFKKKIIIITLNIVNSFCRLSPRFDNEVAMNLAL